MKVIRIHEFGGAEVLKLEEIERPVPAADEVLIKVYASGINPVDWVVRNGHYATPISGLPAILGWEVAGTVEETGSHVTQFKKGNAVYGHANYPGGGCYAEFVAVKTAQLGFKPKNISFNEAGGMALAGLTAWSGIFHYGKLQAGQRILINNASGGVGSLALQFAKAKGAYVIGTSSSGNHDFLKQLGADEVIDYRTQKFEELLQDIDVVFDASPVRGNDEARLNSVKILKQGGILVSANPDFPYSDAVQKALDAKGITAALVQEREFDWLNDISALIEAGKVRVFISKTYPLEQAAEAQRESEAGHVRGKLVLEVRKEK
ncbi:NADP-dependent oxidoreductase [Chitinophaga pendula]|uniref:NADP-dependent oxidoreductase n=1 Tax=Chitinophaga TaxID=79328 RepID=UPI000BAEDBD3|nr:MULTISPECIES: NADP-dependent oxidoreductase [Chitinophaga]ASZ10212.1 alcohol dehydrogenase [Chitinophaga sp. MD30]UCJ06829.1 NADP-dependent oxidoreductase [Chitinophaga pendula]